MSKTSGRREGSPQFQPKNAAAKSRSRWRLPSAWRFSWGSLLRGLLIAVLAFSIWSVIRGRTDGRAWDTPTLYDGDCLQMFGWIQAASEGDYVPFLSKQISRLNAPYQANWNDHPMYEEILTYFIGLLTRWVGIFRATNIAIVLSFVTSALGFYACSRLLRHNKVWAMAGALLFAFAYYNTWRGLGHLLLSYSFTVPFAVVCSWVVLASQRIKLTNFWGYFCMISAAVIGFSNPYNLNMYLQLMGLSLVAHFAWRRRKENLVVGVVSLGIAMVAFFSVNLDTITYRMAHGYNPAAMPRSYFQTELAGLKPLELILPPANHRFEFLGDIARKYATTAWVKGEFFSPYLGFAGIASLVWLLVTFAKSVADPRRDFRHIPPHVPQCAWIVLYSTIGGINGFLALFGLLFFRASNRYSIFISAICLLFAASRLTTLTRRWGTPKIAALAALIVVVGLWDQLPLATTREETSAVANLVDMDRAFGEEMDRRIPPQSMVFQLPVMKFPEGGPIGQIQEYEMLRPYVHTKTLNFTFGSNQGRPREDWQMDLQKQPIPEIVKRLESYGFGAIYINQKGLKQQVAPFVAELQRLGKTNVFTDALDQQVCILLAPSKTPVLPPNNKALIEYKRGWTIEEQTQEGRRHWTGDNATLALFSEEPSPATFVLTGTVAALTARKVDLIYEGRVVWSQDLQASSSVPLRIELNAMPGRNYIHVKTDRPGTSPQPNSMRVAVGFGNLTAAKVAR